MTNHEAVTLEDDQDPYDQENKYEFLKILGIMSNHYDAVTPDSRGNL